MWPCLILLGLCFFTVYPASYRRHQIPAVQYIETDGGTASTPLTQKIIMETFSTRLLVSATMKKAAFLQGPQLARSKAPDRTQYSL